MADNLTAVSSCPSVYPSDYELEVWNSLTRDEQLKSIKEELEVSVQSGVVSCTAEDIRREMLDKQQ